MDNPAQTIAQAVQAATQAQQAAQQASHSPSVQPPSQPAPTSTVDNLTCQWQGCGERCDSAETLYDHVCERHVGRKSTNNLNLTCQWGACRTTTVKRDHITSHIRVHVPLKPHKCDFCGKAFKRPQDLKKHVKTHADDSVLSNSPHSGNAGRTSLGAGGMVNGKSGYYGSGHDSALNGYSGYSSGLGANGGANGYQHNQQYAGYGSVSYPMTDIQSMDTRRRAIEALNDFLGDIKRRAINPQTYYDVGHRLQGNSLPLPINSGGYNTGYSNPSSGYNGMSAASLIDSFSNGDHMGGGGGGGGSGTHVGHQNYSLPLPNARTKSDLQDIDRFLEQLQATVYETSTQAEASGVQQPGVHSQYTGGYNFQNTGSWGHVSAAGNTMPGAHSVETPPGLTPGSQTSYASSSHSPMSTHSRASLSSNVSEPLYPSLPSVTRVSDFTNSLSAPAPSLATAFVNDTRRGSGGTLQREAPAVKVSEPKDVEMTDSKDTDMPDADDGSRTPKASAAKPARAGSIDPSLRDELETAADSASTPARSETEDKREEGWVENMRTIEALRKYIAERLNKGDFEEESTDQSEEDARDAEVAAKLAAETAKMVEQKLADSEGKKEEELTKETTPEVKYPALPTSSD